MKLTESHIYHVFNRGTNKQLIFYQLRNYHYFLGKMKRWIVPTCNLLAYCLMPNHFHFLIQANHLTVQEIVTGDIRMNSFSNGLKHLLGGYARGLNKQEKRIGSVFMQKTKIKAVQNWNLNYDYAELCFQYIHLNPMNAGFVFHPADWPYSSWQEYLGNSVYKLCNIKLGCELFDEILPDPFMTNKNITRNRRFYKWVLRDQR